MDYQDIVVEKLENVGKITINRPDQLNAVSRRVLEEMEHALKEFKKDQDVRVVVLTGAGEKAFSAGADLKGGMFTPETDSVQGAKLARLGQEFTEMIERYEKPVIAAVNGLAFGGGWEIAMACDVIVASENAQFSHSEINLGLIPGWGGTQRLPRLIGKNRAKELILTGDRLTAKDAERIGMVNRVVPSMELQQSTLELARKLAAKSPVMLRLVKQTINRGIDMDMRSGLAEEVRAFRICFTTQDFKEGLTAFMEKRPPKFEGK
jgi:enoyl-CoA hydratase/carnithine racemase